MDFGCKRRRGRPKQNKGALVRLKNENCKFIEEEEVLSYTESECESEKEEQVKEKKKRVRKRKDVKKNTVGDDDDFDLFKDLPIASAAANTLSNITHSINNVSLNENSTFK